MATPAEILRGQSVSPAGGMGTPGFAPSPRTQQEIDILRQQQQFQAQQMAQKQGVGQGMRGRGLLGAPIAAGINFLTRGSREEKLNEATQQNFQALQRQQELEQLQAQRQAQDAYQAEIFKKSLEGPERLSSSEVINGQMVTIGPDGRPVAIPVENLQQRAESLADVAFQRFQRGDMDADAYLDAIERITAEESAPDQFATFTDPATGQPVQVNLATGQEATSPRQALQVQAQEQQQRQAEREAEQGAAEARASAMMGSVGTTLSAIDNVLNHPGLSSATGPIGSRLSPSRYLGSGRDAVALADQLENRVFIDTLQSMREMSSTGGAVGNVSDKEGSRLANALVSLDRAQSDKQYREQLTRLRSILQESLYNIQNAYDSQYGGGGDVVSEAEAILRGN